MCENWERLKVDTLIFREKYFNKPSLFPISFLCQMQTILQINFFFLQMAEQQCNSLNRLYMQSEFYSA